MKFRRVGTYLFQCNVLSVQGLDKVLLAVDDLELAKLVKFADITSLEPAVIGESLLVLLFVVKVTLGNTTTTDPDLTLWWTVGRKVAGILKVNELDFDGSWDPTKGLVGPSERVSQGAHGGGLGKTVSRDERSDSHGDEALSVLGDWTTTVQADAQTATCCLLDLAEDNGINYASADAGEWDA